MGSIPAEGTMNIKLSEHTTFCMGGQATLYSLERFDVTLKEKFYLAESKSKCHETCPFDFHLKYVFAIRVSLDKGI